MIQLAALKALPWRLIGAGVAVAALVAFGWRVNEWRQGYHARAAAEARTAEIAKEAGEAMAKLAEQHRAALTASQGYQDELQSLRTVRDAAPSRPVRVCQQPRLPAAGANSTAPGRPDGSPAGSGSLPQESGPDIGPDLYRDADQADEVSARLRALQEWVRATR